ncbi:sister chromatid cohesion protein PDS5 homolog B-A-like isoform X1 [Xenopus laevis]|uniref:Sister chromatid cohesion protein PDS5 homolog B-A-like isoform X1 n=1 Tax=Xenopus laevis TaxID=8355 RepID=A0A8J0VN95_XENLA|nr:sister chromatid cohesion protein PDS5 homolog B-A-like isoform X1 [Xenopus laevis]
MGTMRFLILLGSLTLLLSLMVSAHSQPGNREGDHLDSVKKNSKHGHHTNRRNENKEVTRRTGVFSALGGERDRTKLSKPRPGFISTVSVKDTPNIMDLSRHSLENGRRRRQSNGKYGKPRKPCPGCYSAMTKPQKQKRKGRNKDGTNNPPKKCRGCFHPPGRSLELKDLEEREPSRKRGHKKPKDRTHPPRGLGRSMKQEREDSEGRRKERGRGEHRHGSLSGLAAEEEPRRPHGHHKKEKHGKHRKNHQHEHSDGKDNKEE